MSFFIKKIRDCKLKDQTPHCIDETGRGKEEGTRQKFPNAQIHI